MPLPGAVLSSGEGGTQGGPALDTPNQTLASHTQHDQQRSGGHDEVGEANSNTENLEENNTAVGRGQNVVSTRNSSRGKVETVSMMTLTMISLFQETGPDFVMRNIPEYLSNSRFCDLDFLCSDNMVRLWRLQPVLLSFICSRLSLLTVVWLVQSPPSSEIFSEMSTSLAPGST